ncbi:hypothetical protein T281_16025 [Rhodomicrobium udaipurense JA643]|uniref:Uncharacterized protein n=1 Tax=Rhodomicrobium udaipurense TaxID=1202716 RepID=A0A8I1GCF9_9HYPH|nr:hypothetical protein [Rhodomicrobium udaipurense]KAI93543.1 hypothetical protein T281_16025 [Rhodomicrobium udaipurense JA643]MBJ7543285.1 hypothetical protein [Rhodomicrobium udaipurense]
MTQGISLSLDIILTLAGIIATVAASYAVMRYQVDDAKKDAAAARQRSDEVGKDLLAFKAEASERFATDETLQRVENRITEAINRLGDRFDRFFEGSRKSWWQR